MSALELLSPVGLVPLSAFAAAALLGMVPSWRVGVWINAAASTLCFMLALRLPWEIGVAGPLWLVDRLSVHMALLTTFVAMTTSWFSLTYIPAEIAARRLDRRRLRLYHAIYQLLAGGMLTALLCNNVAIAWVAMEIATLAAVVAVGLARTAHAMAASWKFYLVCGVGLALALFGTIVLYVAMLPATGPGLPAMSWSAILPQAARGDGTMLNLAFALLLVGYGTLAGLAPLHFWLADAQSEGPTPLAAVLAGSMLNAALVLILRLRQLMAGNAEAIDPGPPILLLAMLSLLLGAFSLWPRLDARRFFAFSTIGQSGLATFAFGLGGSAAIFAGVLHLTLHTLIKASVFQCIGRAAQMKGSQEFSRIGGLIVSHRALGLTLAAGILALAALPPFGLFTSTFLIISETFRRLPLASLPLGIGLVVGFWALMMRLHSLCLGTPTPNCRREPLPAGASGVRDALALVPIWAQLAIVLLFGLAMPAPVFNWLRLMAEAAQ